MVSPAGERTPSQELSGLPESEAEAASSLKAELGEQNDITSTSVGHTKSKGHPRLQGKCHGLLLWGGGGTK